MTHSLYKLTRNSQDFLFSFGGNNRSRSVAFSFAVAAAVSVHLCPDPASPDEDFRVHRRLDLVSRLSTLNEMIRLDVDQIVGFSDKIFRFQQGLTSMVAGECRLFSCLTSQKTAVEDLFGISRYFTTEDLNALKENAQQFYQDRLALLQLFADIDLFKKEGVSHG